MDKKAFFKAVAEGRKSETVKIFNHDVVLHEITASDYFKASKLGTEDVARSDCYLIVAGCDDFEDSDMDDLLTLPLKTTQSLAQKVLALSGLGEDDKEDPEDVK